jgi:hypothetical protein
MNRQDADRPMPLAEVDHCCGELHLNEYARELIPPCHDCPLLIERKREQVLKLARAE